MNIYFLSHDIYFLSHDIRLVLYLVLLYDNIPFGSCKLLNSLFYLELHNINFLEILFFISWDKNTVVVIVSLFQD